MRGTDSNGHEYIFMPKDRAKAVNKLADLSALAATREWERAALIALLVESKGRGRPRSGKIREFERYSISDFARLSIYGFRSPNTISAYLKIWSLTGLPVPGPGDKVTLPVQEFPDMNEVYGRDKDKEIELEEEDVEEEFEGEEEETEPAPAPRRPRPGKSPSPPSPGRAIERLLAAFNSVSPAEVAEGASVEQVRLTLKTLSSWVSDLREVLDEMIAQDE
jgi:hypothetical protein